MRWDKPPGLMLLVLLGPSVQGGEDAGLDWRSFLWCEGREKLTGPFKC